MVTLEQEPDRLRAVWSPRLYLAFYVLFLLVFVVLSARLAMQGEGATAMGLLLAGAGVGIGAILLFVEWSEVALDRAAGQVTWRRKTALRVQSGTLDLAEVAEAVDETPFNDGKGTSHRPALLLRDGTRQSLRRVYMSRRDSRRIVAAINGWLAEGRGPG